MNTLSHRIITACAALLLAVLLAPMLRAQETRGSIYGSVTDSTGGAVPGAKVAVTNVETGAVSHVQTNDSGYYEALLLLPGSYEVSAEVAGFKKAVRKGINLSIGSRAQADIKLEIGAVTESVTVTSDAPLLETSAVTSGRVIDNRSIRDLPVLNNNATLLTRLTPGVQVGNAYGYTNPAFTFLGSEVSTGGNVGGNSFSIDGVQSRADRRRVAYQPHPDTIQEFRIETANFDASVGGSSGLFVSTMTRAGTNGFHGGLSWQHWRSEWNAVPYFIKKNYNDNLAAARASGDANRIKLLESQVLVPSQHSNNYAASIGGPVRLPKRLFGPASFDGRDKLFFFFNYNGLKDRMFRTGYGYRTVPTEAHRRGDFSDLLALGTQYQIYDPLTTRPDPARPGHVIRDPFPNNIIPQARFNNPAYQAYTKLLPLPNVIRTIPLENYSLNYVGLVPWRFDYGTWSTRVDYNLTGKHRIFARMLQSKNVEHNQDWLYQHAPGYGEAQGLRKNIGGTVDWVYTATSNLIFDFSASIHQFAESNEPIPVQNVKPSTLGLPSYLDDFAAARGKFHFPQFNVSSYDTVATWNAIAHPPGVPKKYRMGSFKGDVTNVRGNHTLRGGVDARYSFKTLTEPGNTSGTFGFSNVWTRKDEDGFAPNATTGLSWAAFLLGLPSNGMTVSWNDNAAAYNPFYAGYAQDSWRVSPKLTLNLGLRAEYDVGVTERYDRMIGYLDKNATLPITQLAQAAYASNPVPELSAANFKVRGGSTYVGANGADRKLYGNQLVWMPRVGASYQLDSKTVLQAGYGIYHDVLNVMDFTASFPADNQFGYSRSTSTNVSLDFGQTWLVGNPRNGVSPLTNPFPVRSDGTRFDAPVRNALGLSAIQGRGFSYIPYDIDRARQHRWRASLQRQLGTNMVVEAAYAGSYSDNVYFNRNINFLPEQYWVGGNIRNTAHLTSLNQNVPNPFLLANFASLQQSNPLIYADMATNGFFTRTTAPKSQLLLPFPNLGGLTERTNDGRVRHHALELSLTRRFSKGLSLDANYTKTRNEATTFLNDFDKERTWLPSNLSRPHRVTVSGIYELPFGKGKPFIESGFLSKIVGGWQVAATHEWQPGPLVSFGNLLYYGDQKTLAKDIKPANQTLDEWYNWKLFPGIARDFNATNRAAYEARIRTIVPQAVLDQMTAAGICGTNVTCTYSNVQPTHFQPTGFHRRVFPVFIDGMRADGINYTNANLQRNFKFKEDIELQLRVDVLNLFNRQSFGGPDGNGRVLTDANGPNRFVQVQGRFRF